MAKSWLQKYSTYEEEIHGSATGITAFAGGGQASATQLTEKFNRIDTVGAMNASVKLPLAKVGKKCFVMNSVGTESLLVVVFPQSGEYIDGFLNGNDTGGMTFVSRVPGGQMLTYECYDDGKWTTVQAPKVIVLQKRVVVSQSQVQSSFTTAVNLLNQYGNYVIDPLSVSRSNGAGYSGNTTGQVTEDSTGVEEPIYEFNYGTSNGFRKCFPNTNGGGGVLAGQQGLYFRTKTGNPTGSGGEIKFYIVFALYLP